MGYRQTHQHCSLETGCVSKLQKHLAVVLPYCLLDALDEEVCGLLDAPVRFDFKWQAVRQAAAKMFLYLRHAPSF